MTAIAFFVLVAVSPSTVFAENKIEIVPFGGYQFWGKLTLVEGDLEFPSAVNYGVMVDFRMHRNGHLELLYNRQDTEAVFVQLGTGLRTNVADVALQYFHIGGVVPLHHKNLHPFVALTLGATEFNPKVSGLSSDWRFSTGIAGGSKFLVGESQRFGIRLQGQLFMTFLGSSTGGFWCGLPGGCFGGVNGQAFLQGNVTAGAIIGF